MWPSLAEIITRLVAVEKEVVELKQELDCERVGHRWVMFEGVFKPKVGCRYCNIIRKEEKE